MGAMAFLALGEGQRWGGGWEGGGWLEGVGFLAFFYPSESGLVFSYIE